MENLPEFGDRLADERLTVFYFGKAHEIEATEMKHLFLEIFLRYWWLICHQYSYLVLIKLNMLDENMQFSGP